MASRVTVEMLRTLLSERGLCSVGFKPALIKRCCANGVALLANADRPAPAGAAAGGAAASGTVTVGAAATGAGVEAAGAAAAAELAEQAPSTSGQLVLEVTPNAPSDLGGVFAAAARPAAAESSTALLAGSLSRTTAGLCGGVSQAVGPGGCDASGPRVQRAREGPHVTLAVLPLRWRQEIVTSRAAMSCQRLDARSSLGAVWVFVVAPMFTGSSSFDVPAQCTDGGLDPNTHPHIRPGETVKSRWSDVRMVHSSCIGVHEVYCGKE